MLLPHKNRGDVLTHRDVNSVRRAVRRGRIAGIDDTYQMVSSSSGSVISPARGWKPFGHVVRAELTTNAEIGLWQLAELYDCHEAGLGPRLAKVRRATSPAPTAVALSLQGCVYETCALFQISGLDVVEYTGSPTTGSRLGFQTNSYVAQIDEKGSMLVLGIVDSTNHYAAVLIESSFGVPKVYEATANAAAGSVTAKWVESDGDVVGSDITFAVLP